MNESNTDSENDEMLESRIPSISIDLKEDIEKFSLEGYAEQYFARRKKSLSFFSPKKIIPLNTLMSWSKSPLSHPLTDISPRFHKDAIKAFKDIQRIMGERSGASTFGPSRAPVVEVQNLISLAVNFGELRDEIFCQIIKQITANPNLKNTRRGWTLLGSICATIPPSKNLQSYLFGFLTKSISDMGNLIKNEDDSLPDEDFSHYIAIYRASRFALKGARRLCMPGITPRLKIPSSEETEHLLSMSLYDSPFGENLSTEEIQYDESGNEVIRIPEILTYLTRSIILLDGLNTPGLFRIAGNNEQISILRRYLEHQEFPNLKNESVVNPVTRSPGKSSKKKEPLPEQIILFVNDAHVPATILKSWLRELEDSVIPESFYHAALAAASLENPIDRINSIKEIVNSIPLSHKTTLEFLVSFLRIIGGEDQGPNNTKMTINNLAIIFGPTLLRAPAVTCNDTLLDISTAFNNAKLEQAFLSTILMNPLEFFPGDVSKNEDCR